RIVIGARQEESGNNLQPVVTLWLMDSSDTLRCQIAVDYELSQAILPNTTEGITGFLPLTTDNSQLTTPCTAGTEVQVGDRLVAEIGYRCTASSAGTIEATFTRGGIGPA